MDSYLIPQIAFSCSMILVSYIGIHRFVFNKNAEYHTNIVRTKTLASVFFILYGGSSIWNILTTDANGCIQAIFLANITYHFGFIFCEMTWLYQCYLFLEKPNWMKWLSAIYFLLRTANGVVDSILSYGQLDPDLLVCVFNSNAITGTIQYCLDVCLDILVTVLNIWALLQYGSNEKSTAFRYGNLFRSIFITGYSIFLIIITYAAPDYAIPLLFVLQSFITISLTLFDHAIFGALKAYVQWSRPVSNTASLSVHSKATVIKPNIKPIRESKSIEDGTEK